MAMNSPALANFQRRLESALKMAGVYSNPDMAKKVRGCLPCTDICSVAFTALSASAAARSNVEANNNVSSSSPPASQSPSPSPSITALPKDDPRRLSGPTEAIVRALLDLFKDGFFQWFDKPKECSGCGAVREGGSGGFESVGVKQATGPAAADGWAEREEVYKCITCGLTQSFFRCNNPHYLLQSPENRRGRCGEWANAFVAALVAIGVTARKVEDFTDHVWAEIWVPEMSRWVHADPCERAFDQPLMYEKGWGKKLTYVIAVCGSRVIDVTKRYTADYAAVAARRTDVPEEWLAGLLARMSGQSVASPAFVKMRIPTRPEEISIVNAEGAGRAPAGEQDADSFGGRTSGDLAWRRARGELGEGGGPK